MKKVLAILLASLTLTTGFNAIAKNGTGISISGSRSDERDVKNFNGVAGAGPINVIITLGNTESCRLEGDAEAIATIVTEVKSGVLVIRPQTSIRSWSNKYEGKKITAYVTAKELASLTISGSGNLTVNGKISTGNLTTTVSGSGNIKVSTDVDDYSGVISGSGSINITGGADHAKVVISSSGTLSGRSFSAKTLNSTISGSGTVNMAVSESIRAVISGSGSVNYAGNPTIDKTVIGSGGVRKL